MTESEKLSALADILETRVDDLDPASRLDTLRWDSMAMLSFLMLVLSRFQRRLTGEELRSKATVRELMELLEPVSKS